MAHAGLYANQLSSEDLTGGMKNVVKWTHVDSEIDSCKFLIITCRWSTELWKRTNVASENWKNPIVSPVFFAGNDNEFGWEMRLNIKTKDTFEFDFKPFKIKGIGYNYTVSLLNKDFALDEVIAFNKDFVDLRNLSSTQSAINIKTPESAPSSKTDTVTDDPSSDGDVPSAGEAPSEKDLVDVERKILIHVNDKHLTRGGTVISIIQGLVVKIGVLRDHKVSNSFETVFNNKSTLVVKDLLEKLLVNPLFSDVTFIIGEEKLEAHKAVLAAISPVFLEMFKEKSTWRKKSYFEIKITDFQAKTVKEMLHFIYTGELLDHGEDSLKQVLIISSKYDIKNLFFKCQEMLLMYLSIDNALELLTLAGDFDAEDVKLSSIDVIADNIEKFDTSKLSDLKPELLTKIFDKIATDKDNKNNTINIVADIK